MSGIGDWCARMTTPARTSYEPSRIWLHLALGIGALVVAPQADAVILYATGSITANSTEPTGPLAGSGWQYEGTFGSSLGTPIAPQYFLSAKHVGLSGPTIVFRGESYTVATGIGEPKGEPTGDLVMWRITGTFPDFAPLYSKKDEVGKPLVVIGRGTQRGSGVFLNSVPKGWMPGNGDGVQRWGENTVSSIYEYHPDDDLIVANFDQDGGPNEAHLTGGDSGGAIFMQDGGAWKLAGINFAVDEVYRLDAPNTYTRLIAPIYDCRGYFYANPGSPTGYTEFTGASPVPTSFYASRISKKLPWIYSITDPAGSLAGDGIPNLLKYGFGMDVTAPASSATSAPGLEPGFVTLTYTKRTTATDITISIERSINFTTWTAATATNMILSTVGTLQTIKAKVALNNEPSLYLRLRVSRP